MKELEELTREIWNKLPRLIYEDEFELFDESNGYRQTEKLLIPEPPMLNDVLEWINDLTEDMANINSEGVIYFTNYWNNPSDKVSNWDLSKSYLKDQSPELIKFLHSLIKTKQL